MNCPICKSKAIFTKKARLICSNRNCASRGGTEQQKQVLKAKKPERIPLIAEQCGIDLSSLDKPKEEL